MPGYIRTITLILCLQFPVSCAFLIPPADSLDRQINLWLKDKQFDRIDKSLKQVAAKKNDYKDILKRKPEIERKKQLYIEQTSKQAQSLKSNHQWQQAIDLYKSSLKNIHDEPRLIKELNQLIAQRDLELSILRKQLLIRNAQAHMSYDEIYSKLEQLVPNDNAAKRDLNRHTNNKAKLAIKLENCGTQAFNDQLMQLAYDCYSVSNLIEPTKQKQYWVDKINKQLVSQINYKRYAELLSQYDSAYKNKKYNQAKLHLQEILAINPNHQQAGKLLKSLEHEINLLISGKINLGKELYSNQKINEALKLWKQIQKLSPENAELIQLIQRAEKVSKKIQSLEHKQ